MTAERGAARPRASASPSARQNRLVMAGLPKPEADTINTAASRHPALAMKRAHLTAAILAAAVVASPLAHESPTTPAAGQAPVDRWARLTTAVPDLGRRLARFKPVRMPFNGAGLTERERQMIDQLVMACRQIESIYWRQSDPEGLALFKALER